MTLLAEIGDFRDFDKPEEPAAWAGIVPSVHQSANKLATGSITKHGSRHIRRILVEVAHVIARTKDSKLNRFFQRVRSKKGYSVETVALARKVLCILHHLLMNQEIYQEEDLERAKAIELDDCSSKVTMRFEELIQSLIRAGYECEKEILGLGDDLF